MHVGIDGSDKMICPFSKLVTGPGRANRPDKGLQVLSFVFSLKFNPPNTKIDRVCLLAACQAGVTADQTVDERTPYHQPGIRRSGSGVVQH